MASPCCTTIYDLGCFDSCKNIQFGSFKALQNGLHIFEIYYFGVMFTYEVSFAINAILTLPNVINENTEAIIKIKQPNGAYYQAGDGSVCFRIQNIIKIAL